MDSHNRSGKRRREDENGPGLEILDASDRSEKKTRREIDKKNIVKIFNSETIVRNAKKRLLKKRLKML